MEKTSEHVHRELAGEVGSSLIDDIGLIAIDEYDEARRENRGVDLSNRTFKHQRSELDTLNRINALLLEIVRELFATSTRADIERTVCERLAASELYQFAWIGDLEPDGDRLVPRVSAGVDEEYVETIPADGSRTGRGPGERAFRTGSVQVSQDVRSDPAFEAWCETTLDRDVRSAAAVPLLNGETTYGVLAVYATRPFAFSHREQAAFETLGEAVGFAIDAVENRNLLFADTVVELEFEIRDSGLVFVRTSEELECELTITACVASESGDWSVYLTVDGAAPTAVRDRTADDSDVDRGRVLAEETDNGLLEIVMTGPALTEIAAYEATLTSGHVDNGRGRFCIEAPQTADIRRLSARLRAAYPESTLVAQREYDRPVQKALEMRQSIDGRLTERQQEALERAHHAGYFDWPRQSTAGDIADTMNIAETTFHYHLRNALDTLSTAFIDDEGR